jgi:hypothetical protein
LHPTEKQRHEQQFQAVQKNPAAPSAITASSIKTVTRMRRDFSYLSASWPAVAEKRKNGSTNNACARFCSTSVDSEVKLTVW